MTSKHFQRLGAGVALAILLLSGTTLHAQSSWTNRYNGPGNGSDVAKAIAVDSSGNVFVTGYATGSGSGSDYATIKYSGAGVPLWTNRYDVLGHDDKANAIAVDGTGNVFVTGETSLLSVKCVPLFL